MEFKNRGAEVETLVGGSLLKNRFVQIIAALLALGFLGFIILVLYLFHVLSTGQGITIPGAQRTATRANVAQATTASTLAAPLATSPLPTATLESTAPTNVTPSATLVTIPTTTPVGSPSPGPQVAPAAKPLPGLYVTRLRTDPSKPRKGDQITFFATLVNTTGESQVHKLCVEIYRLGEDNSFGITSCPPQTVPIGTNELTAGSWKLAGIHECLPIRARAITNDDAEPRNPLRQPGGSAFWFDLQVCP